MIQLGQNRPQSLEREWRGCCQRIVSERIEVESRWRAFVKSKGFSVSWRLLKKWNESLWRSWLLAECFEYRCHLSQSLWFQKLCKPLKKGSEQDWPLQTSCCREFQEEDLTQSQRGWDAIFFDRLPVLVVVVWSSVSKERYRLKLEPWQWRCEARKWKTKWKTKCKHRNNKKQKENYHSVMKKVMTMPRKLL